MKRELIKTIRIDKANIEHIAKTGEINGTLLIEIERIMTEYARKQANGVEQSDSNCNIPLVSPCYDRDDLQEAFNAGGIGESWENWIKEYDSPI